MIALLAATILIAPPADGTQYRQPQLAADGEHAVIVFGAKNDILVSVSNDGGRRFAPPVKIDSAGVLSLGMHRAPRVAMDSGSIIVSAITGEKGRGQDGDLLAWRSHDQGRTWAGPVRVNDAVGSAREGLHAMTAHNGKLYTVWLDLRSKGTKLYTSISEDAGATWSKNALVYESPGGSICECCHPTVAASRDGAIYVMFRNSIDGSRNMYLVKSTDRGRTFGAPVKLGSGDWVLNACPMDGGSLGVDRKGKTLAVWRRKSEIYLSTNDNPEQKLGEGKDAAIAVTPLGPYFAAWTSSEGLKLLRPGAPAPETLDGSGRYIQLLSAGGHVYAAWERNGAIVFEILR